jgi:hypothetical protein
MSKEIEKKTFRKLDLDPSSGEGRDCNQLFLRDPAEHVSPSLYLKTETYPISEAFYFLII